MAQTANGDNETDALLAQFIVLGRLDAAFLSFAFAAIILASFLPWGSSSASTFIILALALLSIGTAINGVRRAIAARKQRALLARSRRRIAEFEQLDTEHDSDAST